jgi:hypothetical protein
MRKRIVVVAVVALIAICGIAPQAFAAEEETLMGVVTKITMEGPDATTATVTLKDSKTKELIDIVINDELTLDKLKDHRIGEGEEIRCKYNDVDGKHVSTYFRKRKTAGC